VVGKRSAAACFTLTQNFEHPHDACEDFSVSADPVDSTRVNIFEKWQSRAALDAFRNAGPESDLFDLVESFDVEEYEV
jgi:quinol monooxygenase YgiN